MNKCPRCKLPQIGVNKCQYCGYDLNKYDKKPAQKAKRKLTDIIGLFKESQIASINKINKVRSLNTSGRVFKRKDNDGNRSGTDRRKQRYITYRPERRSGLDRRK
jgi:hypothetical protein